MDFSKFPELAKAARGEVQADLVFRGGNVINVFTGEILRTSVAVKDGTIVGVGDGYVGAQEIDLTGKYLCPGFIDAHLHLESTMVTPAELVERRSSAARRRISQTRMRRQMSAARRALIIFWMRRRTYRPMSM